MSINVLHSHPVWLPLTQTWLANLIELLPPQVASNVVCNIKTANPPTITGRVYCEQENSQWTYRYNRALSRLRLPAATSFRARIARQSRDLIVHSHFGNAGWQDLPFVRASGCKHVVSFYGQDAGQLPQENPRWRRRYVKMFKKVDAVLCEGPFMAQTIKSLGCPPEKIHVHHLGIDLKPIEHKPRHYRQGDKLRVLLAASFREKKGIPDGLHAINLAACHAGIEVTLIGDSTSEPETQEQKREIFRWVDMLRPRVAVRVLGFRPYAEMLREAYGHHVFLHPSVTARNGDSEGGAPMAILEMAASGMQVVSTRHCDIPEILPRSSHHLLADEHDPDGLARALLWLTQNPERWAELSLANRKHAEMNYDGVTQGRRLAEIYANLLCREKQPAWNVGLAHSRACEKHPPQQAGAS